MAKFKETCEQCRHHQIRRVGDSFDRAKAWYCFHPATGTSKYFDDHPVIDSYRDEKDGAPEIPEWCYLPDLNRKVNIHD